MSHELLPCPFCGHDEPTHDEGDESAWVQCTNAECGMCGPIASGPALAATAWNRRATQPAIGYLDGTYRESLNRNGSATVWGSPEKARNPTPVFLATQPAAVEPVAPKEVGEMTITVRDGMTWFAFEEYGEAYKLPEGLHYLYTAPPASAHGDEAVPADLKARCREIAQWRKSGVLRGDALRKYAESRWPGDPSALQMAEHETATEAFQVVSAMRAQAGEGGEV